MSKKFVYFKYSINTPADFAGDQLALLASRHANEDLRPVQTIFQLMDQPDLKLIISKNELLQRNLSAQLPQTGLHGFLWTGEQLPELLDQVLRRSIFVNQVFIFQRNTDPAPEYGNPVRTQLEIYNWWVFQYSTFFAIYKRGMTVRQENHSLLEMDKKFQNVKAQNEKFLASPKRNEPDSLLFGSENEKAAWLQPVLNYLSPPLCLLNVLRETTPFTALSGWELCFWEQFHGVNWRFKAFAAFDDWDLAGFQKEIDVLLSSLRLLLSSSDDTQTDLFVDPLGQSFSASWQTEKERLQEILLSLTPENRKAFAVADFLIKRQLFENSELLKYLFEGSLQETTRQVLRKTNGQDFVTVFQKKLNGLYADLHILNKIKTSSTTVLKRWKIIEEELDFSQEPFTSIVFTPMRWSDQNLHKTDQLLQRLFNSSVKETIPPAYEEELVWHDEIGMQGRMFRRAGRAGKYLFNRLYSQNRKQEAVTLFRDWQQTDSFLQKLAKDSSATEICLVFPCVQIDEKRLSIIEIVLEMLEHNELLASLQITHRFFSGQSSGAGSEIIILKKEKNV